MEWWVIVRLVCQFGQNGMMCDRPTCQFGQNGMMGDRPTCLSVWTEWNDESWSCFPITMAGMPCQKKEEEKKGKADLTTVLHIRELPHLHMKLAVWFSFPTTNNKNPMIPS